MRIRIVLSTGAAVLAAAAIASATDVGGGRSPNGPVSDVPERPQSASTPALRPGHMVAASKPMTAAERDAVKAALEARMPPADVLGNFAALRRSAEPYDRLPSDQGIGTAVGVVDLDGARRLVDSELGTVRAVPTDRELCISTTYTNGRSEGATDTCVPAVEAKTRGAWTITQCSSDQYPQRRFIAGAVPDGVDTVTALREGEVVSAAAVADNGFTLETNEPIDQIRVGGSSFGLPAVSC